MRKHTTMSVVSVCFYGNARPLALEENKMPAGKGGNKTAKMVAKGEKKGGMNTGLAKASDACSIT